MPDVSQISYKVVLLGTTGVGKTSILLRHKGDSFTTHVSPTIGASFCKSHLTVDNTVLELQIWDTAGQERFRAMVIAQTCWTLEVTDTLEMPANDAPMYYRNANAAFAVYDITCAESFAEMKSWVKELQQRAPQRHPVICILGNKCDMKDDRVVSEHDGKQYAAEIGALFYETSAFTGSGIERAVRSLCEEILERHGQNEWMGEISGREDGQPASTQPERKCYC